ncbi:glutathione S-transferase [Macrolepiota fuliginosa MF-IS2]|uniref:glutathione transferase n=1 Tax=Macrolepiota fuliginosa MF-IS2 TaxID=1400762 RepID=A0A9P5XCR3_9AGAR|nr:glutathione S-transferase [Macrolepiota fuliginosa MF-IS2]
MTLKFYGYQYSTASQLVGVVLHEKGIPFEYSSIDLRKHEHKTLEFLARQPFGQVPYIDDDGFILYESQVICRYLESKYPNQRTKLIPTDPKQRALFEQAASIEMTNFDYYGAPAIFEVLFKKVDELTKLLAAKLDVYEQILSKQRYLAGDELTLADLSHIPVGTLLPVAGIDVIQERPNVLRWFNGLTDRGSWKKVKEGLKNTA